MRKFAILADPTCDINDSFQKKYDIRVVKGHLALPDGSEIPSISEWGVLDRAAFYADLKKHPDSYHTSPPNVKEFSDAYTECIGDGQDVLMMTISAGMSGTYNFACKAREEVLKKYPDAKIYVVDSLRFGPGFGLMAVHASLLREEGKSLEEVHAYIEENKNRFHQAGWLDDLSFVAKKGRLTHAKAFFGTLAGIKPIGEFDYNGMTTVLGKVKGAKAAYAVLLNYIADTVENPEEQIIFIAETNRRPQAEEYKKFIEERFHPKEIHIIDVFPSSGINVGPGLMAAYYVGKPISKDLSQERAIIDKAISKGE